MSLYKVLPEVSLYDMQTFLLLDVGGVSYKTKHAQNNTPFM